MLGTPVHWCRWHCLLLPWQEQWVFQLGFGSQSPNQCPLHWTEASLSTKGLHVDSSTRNPFRLSMFLCWGHQGSNMGRWSRPSKILLQWQGASYTWGLPIRAEIQCKTAQLQQFSSKNKTNIITASTSSHKDDKLYLGFYIIFCTKNYTSNKIHTITKFGTM